MQSLWSKTVELPERAVWEGDRHVENLVIGAGMAGVLIAYFLQESGQEVIILEAAQTASGQTKNTTAKITAQHGLIYYDMLKKAGRKRAEGYAKANQEAIDSYEEIIREKGIACEFERLPAYLYSTERAGVRKLEQEAQAAKALGIDAGYVEGKMIRELPFPVTGAVRFEQQAQFHPLEFIRQLSAGLTIYENTKVLSVKGHVVSTNCGSLTADNIIFATHYPFPTIPGFYFLRQHQERSYVLALEGGDAHGGAGHCGTGHCGAGQGDEEHPPISLSGMYYGIDKGGLSFRRAGEHLLLGGGSHRTGKKNANTPCRCTEHAGAKSKEPNNPEGYGYLRQMAERYYPHAKETAAWAAQDCMPHDHIPFIGKYSVFRPYWYVATGFQKWGMTSSMIAARIISDQICHRDNPYQQVFSPRRFLVRAGCKDFVIDVGESILGLTKGLFGKKKRRCRHMGCHLEWNEEEKSWDCPCHGSRFTKNGELIDNPAQMDLY